MEKNLTDQIAAIQEEIRATPYHKATEHHVGRLKAKLSKLKDQLYQSSSKGKSSGKRFALPRSGDASIALVGFPSVGKSTLLNRLTNAKSKVAPYEFTTLTVIPGMLAYQGAQIQIFDIPGLITGAATGRGRGKQVLAIARNTNLILIVADANHPKQITKIENELHQSGVRVNQTPPAVNITKKEKGGIILHTNIKQNFTQLTVESIAHELGLKNAEITLKQKLTLDQLVDALAGNRAYLPAIAIINKTDTISPSQFNKLNTKFPHALLISAQTKEGLDKLKQAIWEKLSLIRIYLKRPGQKRPDYAHPLIMKKDQTIKHVAEKVSSDLAQNYQFAKISGPGAAYPNQKVPLTTPLKNQMEVTFT